MKAEQREFIEIMDSFRKLNIACMLPAEISHGEFSLLKMIQYRIESEAGSFAECTAERAETESGKCGGNPAGRGAAGSLADTGTEEDSADADAPKNFCEGVKVSWLVKKSHVPAPAVSRTLRTLEQKGFIERTVDKEDRRNTFVSLTEVGFSINREIDNIMEGFADAVFGNMGEETMQKMNGYLKQFLETSRCEIEKRRYIDNKDGKNAK